MNASLAATPSTTDASPAQRSRPAWMRAWGPDRGASRRINLALQGGGAHGAFTWGVLDALLADPRIGFEGLSGSSAGALNAAVMAHGWLDGGREGAREALATFWAAVGRQLPALLVSHVGGDAIDLAPAGKMIASWAAHFSPSQLNPLDLNPLRGILDSSVDFERLRARCPFKLFVGATRANSGALRVFREHELTLEVLLASACLPRMHHAVEIDGEAYWDGGYSANPAVFPLFYECDSRDVLLVLLAPLRHEGAAHTIEDIESRIAEFTFSSHFMREMRTFAQATAFARPALLGGGRLDRRLRAMRFHMIDTSELPALQRAQTRLLAYGPFLERLHSQGHERGADWLAQQHHQIGRRSTLDLQALFG